VLEPRHPGLVEDSCRNDEENEDREEDENSPAGPHAVILTF
jgi:hypothetical protein